MPVVLDRGNFTVLLIFVEIDIQLERGVTDGARFVHLSGVACFG